MAVSVDETHYKNITLHSSDSSKQLKAGGGCWRGYAGAKNGRFFWGLSRATAFMQGMHGRSFQGLTSSGNRWAHRLRTVNESSSDEHDKSALSVMNQVVREVELREVFYGESFQ